jgi:CubicO group peptidase (beta-lactamase class C family)
MDSEKLVAMLESLEKEGANFHNLLVIRHGYVVLDASTYPFKSSQSHWMSGIASNAVSALTGIAIDQGYIKSVDQSIWDFFSRETTANMDARKEAITLAHLLTDTAGLNPSYGVNMYKLTADDQSWVQYVLDAPLLSTPGQQFGLSDANAHLVSAIISKATGQSAFEFAQANLFGPLGMTDVSWWADPQGVSVGDDGIAWSAYDLAKLGYLYLHHGEWDGQQIVSPGWIEMSTSPLIDLHYPPNYAGYFWWISKCGGSDQVPCYAGAGIGISLWVVPDLDLIIVATGSYVNSRSEFVDPYIVPAVQSDAALPPNPAAQEMLQAKVDAFANPVAVAVPTPPDVQGQISGQTYALEGNELGWTSLMISFGEREGLLTLEVQGRGLELPVGLDGVFRVSSAGLPGDMALFRPASDIPLALKGTWQGNLFVITARDLLGALNGQFKLSLSDDTLRLSVGGEAGLPENLTITGTPHQ